MFEPITIRNKDGHEMTINNPAMLTEELVRAWLGQNGPEEDVPDPATQPQTPQHAVEDPAKEAGPQSIQPAPEVKK